MVGTIYRVETKWERKRSICYLLKKKIPIKFIQQEKEEGVDIGKRRP